MVCVCVCVGVCVCVCVCGCVCVCVCIYHLCRSIHSDLLSFVSSFHSLCVPLQLHYLKITRFFCVNQMIAGHFQVNDFYKIKGS